MSLSSTKTLHSASIAAAVALAIAASAAQAQQAPASTTTTAAAEPGSTLQEVIVTGTRTSGLQAAESPAPVQILSPQALAAASGNPELMATLSQIVPSLTMEAFGFDQAGQTLMAKLRGLSPNDVLILINGKRRHTTANLAIDGGSVYQGGANVDLNFIPLDAIDHIEVLTDGAAAQYGSDAVAGVINIILKKNSSGGSVTGTTSHNWDDQGPTGDVSGNFGLEPYDGAYFNVTGEVRNHGHTDHSDAEPQAINEIGTYPNSNMTQVPGYPQINMIEGDGEEHLKMAMLNAGFPFLDDAVTAYLTGSYAWKEGNSYENYRIPQRISATIDGVTTYPFPFGFDPQEETLERDYQITGGFKGVVASWNWDVSSGFGQDHVAMYTIDTIGNSFTTPGPTYGVPTASNLYDGFLESSQSTTTLDFNRDFDVGMAGPLNVAVGAEYRHEFYTIGSGTPESYIDGGAQSFPGFTPSDAGSNGRQNESVYVDFAARPIDKLRIDLAGRYEHYSDFGNTEIGKITARYDFTPEFALRGTVSNGFRAPTLAEEFYSATNVGPTTATVQLPPNSVGGRFVGLGNGLQPEKSVNYSFGAVWRPVPNMSMTLDVYSILLTNRIVGTGTIYGTISGVPTTAAPLVNEAIKLNGNELDPVVLATGTTGITQFANGIDTVTRGADLVFQFPYDYAWGHVNWTVSGTYNDTYISRLPPTPAALISPTNPSLYNVTAQSDLTSASPRFLINLGGLWSLDKFSVNLVEKVIGPSHEYDNDGGANPSGIPIYYVDEIPLAFITNLDIGIKFTKNASIHFGANNLFNKFPPKQNPTLLNHFFTHNYSSAVDAYPIFSPYGIDGGYYYGKVTLSF